MRDVLEGTAGPYRDMVLLNSAAALVVAGKAGDLADGMAQAGESLDSGRAEEVLNRLVAITNEEVAP